MCDACHGDSRDCAHCGGTGFEPIERCPRATLRDNPEVRAFFAAFFTLDQYHILPQAGGSDDQSATFLEAVRFVAPIIAELRAPRVTVAEAPIDGR